MAKFRLLQEPIRLQDLLNFGPSRAEKNISYKYSHNVIQMVAKMSREFSKLVAWMKAQFYRVISFTFGTLKHFTAEL